MIENLEWNSIDEVNMMNQMEHVNRLLIVSTYALMVLMILIAQILFTLIVILFMSLSYQSNFSIASLIQTTASGLFVLIALVIALLICFVKKINETFPENVTLAIAYSGCMALALGIWYMQLYVLLKIAAFGITSVLFICAVLIGAAIKTNLADQIKSILISITSIFITFIIAAIALVFSGIKVIALVFYIAAVTFSFIITIFISYITIGKLRCLIFYPNYSLASILLYTVFFNTLATMIDIINICSRLLFNFPF
ncbi:unnamed protein product [Schistosoma bovis]|nr:unnamed protein product [Schistosoma bovis]